MRHREFITNIGASSNFNDGIYSTGINPGDGKTFPWLSQLAKGFERYRVNSMRFTYEPFTATTKTGTVTMFVDYDPSDSGPQSKSELLNSYRSVRSSLWMSTSTLLSQKELQVDDHLFVRTVSRPLAQENLKLYDIGTFFCAFTDTEDTTTLHGEIWVTYDVTLMMPAFHRSVVNSGEVNQLEIVDTQFLGRLDPDSSSIQAGTSLNFETHQVDTDAYIQFNEPFTGLVQLQTTAGPGTDTFQIEPTLSPTAPIGRLAKIGNAVSHFISAIDGWIHTVEVVAAAGERLAWKIVERSGSPGSWAGKLDLLFTEYAPILMGPLLALASEEDLLVARLQATTLSDHLDRPIPWSTWRAQHGIPPATTN